MNKFFKNYKDFNCCNDKMGFNNCNCNILTDDDLEQVTGGVYPVFGCPGINNPMNAAVDKG